MCRVISLALPLGLLVLLVKWITHKRIESEIHNFKIKMETISVSAEEEEDEVEPVIMVGLPRVRVVRSLKGRENGRVVEFSRIQVPNVKTYVFLRYKFPNFNFRT